MVDPNSFINLGELSKPATVLIEKISDAIVGIAKPHQMKRIAKAQAEVEITQAETQIKISEMQYRALERMISVEGKKLENIEQITEKALCSLKEDAKPNEIENDWITNFFDKCDKITDVEMQSMWAKILAGEANKPGTFSKRTVNNLASLDKYEANWFTNLCRFGFDIVIGNVYPLIYNLTDEIYKNNGIDFNGLSHLESIGLISFNNVQGYVLKELPNNFLVSYYGNSILLTLPKNQVSHLKIGCVLLTRMGQELAPICGSQAVEGFVDYIKKYWNNIGYIC